MTDFTPFQSLLGGILIGLSAVLLMALHGRIAGMTGILTGVIPPVASDWRWRAVFLAGAVAAPVIYLLAGGVIPFSVPVPSGACLRRPAGRRRRAFRQWLPSGHGICGLARFSPRSLAAVATFMLAAFVTVYVIRHVIGG